MSKPTTKKPAVKRLRGRPSLYTPAVGAMICERLGNGETLADICREHGAPSASTVDGWRAIHASFGDAYAQARARRPTRAVDGKKQCTRCKKVVALTEFNINRNARDGLAWRCRECAAIVVRAQRERVAVVRDRTRLAARDARSLFSDWVWQMRFERAIGYTRMSEMSGISSGSIRDILTRGSAVTLSQAVGLAAAFNMKLSDVLQTLGL